MAAKKRSATLKEHTIKTEDHVTVKSSPNQPNTTAKKMAPANPGEMPPVGTLQRQKHQTGVLFVSHLPGGFFENELRDFFQQFGAVIKVFVGRSKRTLRSKGYGYVQFKYYDVAQIAASAVDKYLLFGRSLRARALPKNSSVIPRNCTKALDGRGRHTTSYQLWLQKQATDINGYVGGERLRVRRKNQAVKLQKAKQELARAGITLPELHDCYVNVAHSAVAKRELEKIANRKIKSEEADLESQSSDEENAFVPLQESDWVIVAQPDVANNKSVAIKAAETNASLLKTKKQQKTPEENRASSSALKANTIGKANGKKGKGTATTTNGNKKAGPSKKVNKR